MTEQIVATTRPFSGRLVAVRIDDVRLASGRHTQREVVEHPGAVGILAWDAARVALVSQWRHAVSQTLLEIPAGTLEPGEEPATTARRELAEECGLQARRWEQGPSFFTAPGFCDERLTLFVASELAPATAQPPEDEELELSWLPIADAVTAASDGRIRDAKSMVGILWLQRRVAG